MNPNDIQSLVQQALMGFFSALPNPRGNGDFVGENDKDAFKTGFPRFYSTDNNADIFTFLSRFETNVANLLTDEEQKKRVLMDRISLQDRQRLSTITPADWSYDDLKGEIGKLLSTSDQGKQFEKYFLLSKVLSTSKVYNHFLAWQEKWNGYTAWRSATGKSAPEESTFLDRFEDSIPFEVRKDIMKLRIDGVITNIQHLGQHINTYKSLFDVEPDNVNTQVLTQLTTLQKNQDSFQKAIEIFAEKQQQAMKVDEAVKSLQKAHNDSNTHNTKAIETLGRENASLRSQLHHMEQASKNVMDTLHSQKYEAQRNYLDLQNQERLRAFALNNMGSPYVHKERQESFNYSRGRERDRKDYSPGRGARSPNNGYSSGESRSPSPNPVDNRCFQCSETH